ncbi:hypothetical protein MU1_09850 [Paenibacillus glycanilyticus]|uniref:alpha-L-rhamnosidase n=1 Tax=Paenibacillus glycanilyticus TaxID=126569 RepID=A0ABQ6GBE9_9BACL|nr:hypothetical protein MU1_09850 [Paenibacillus glycanilyticus]
MTDSDFVPHAKLNFHHKELDKQEVEPHRTDLLHHHWYARTTFMVSEADLEADFTWLDLTADDYYKVYVNGTFLAQGPAQSDSSHYYFNRLPIRERLQVGLNVIAVHVYYQGLRNRAYNSADYRQGLIAELWAGEKLIVRSDRTWKVKRAEENTAGIVFGYETQFTERLDARKAEVGWTTAGYDDSAWLEADVASIHDYDLVPQPTPVLSVYTNKPASVDKLGPGHYLIDFGTELTGQFTMIAQGAAGDEIEIRSGEELQPGDQAVRYDMRCNCHYSDRWILSGREDRFETYDYKAFRYVEVLGPEGVMEPESFAAVVRHYPLDDNSCIFQCSDELVAKVFDICKTGVKLGAQENFVDCPSREKGQYLGDNTVIGHSHMLISGDGLLVRKAIEEFARSSAICPGLMAVVPGHYMQEIADFSLQWPMQLLEYYRQSGDLDFLREMHPYAEGLLNHFETFEREDGLLERVEDKWNLVDWPANLRDEYDFELTLPIGPGCHNVLNAYYMGCRQTVAEIRRILGLPDRDTRLAERIR